MGNNFDGVDVAAPFDRCSRDFLCFWRVSVRCVVLLLSVWSSRASLSRFSFIWHQSLQCCCVVSLQENTSVADFDREITVKFDTYKQLIIDPGRISARSPVFMAPRSASLRFARRCARCGANGSSCRRRSCGGVWQHLQRSSHGV